MCFCHFLRPLGHNFDEERERGEKKERQREREGKRVRKKGKNIIMWLICL